MDDLLQCRVQLLFHHLMDDHLRIGKISLLVSYSVLLTFNDDILVDATETDGMLQLMDVLDFAVMDFVHASVLQARGVNPREDTHAVDGFVVDTNLDNDAVLHVANPYVLWVREVHVAFDLFEAVIFEDVLCQRNGPDVIGAYFIPHFAIYPVAVVGSLPRIVLDGSHAVWICRFSVVPRVDEYPVANL